jgi:hypothetical protein
MHSPIFAYWHSKDHSPILEMVAEWSAFFPQFRIYGDEEILPMIEEIRPDFVDTFLRVRLPTARSDIARYLLLYRFGGLYVDCHCGIGNRDGIMAMFSRLEVFDHIFVDRALSLIPRRPEQHFLLSAIQMSRRNCAHNLAIACQAMENLTWQRQVEEKVGFSDYCLMDLCGPRLLTDMTLQPGSCGREVRRDLASRILIVREEDCPIARNRHRSYTMKGSHWSQRQTKELLFKLEQLPDNRQRRPFFHNWVYSRIRALGSGR